VGRLDLAGTYRPVPCFQRHFTRIDGPRVGNAFGAFVGSPANHALRAGRIHMENQTA